MATIHVPQIPSHALGAAIDGFEKIVGADSVVTAPEDLQEFRDPFQPPSWDEYTASAVVMPTTVEELQAIVRVANERKVPLWAHGQGRNNGYGGAAPRVKGSVIVSLRKMNRVLEIDEELGYAVVEPGVRWFDLYEALREGGHKLWLSCADLGWGSVDRKLARQRRHVPPVRQRLRGPVRTGGRARQRGAAAHRHGSDARQRVVARLQARVGPGARSAVHAVELRDRHEDGAVADAAARGLHAAVDQGVARRRPRAARPTPSAS